MTNLELQVRLEFVYEILSGIHGYLCRSRLIEEAEQLQDLMIRLIKFSNAEKLTVEKEGKNNEYYACAT